MTTEIGALASRIDRSGWLRRYGGWVTVLAVGIGYAYWPTIVWMVRTWSDHPDYSHGFLVLPLATMIAWHRRSSLPSTAPGWSIGGMTLIVAAVAMRITGRLVYADFLDAWSLVVLVAGILWFAAGPAVARWAAPAVGFLVFASPMPYQIESTASVQLRALATTLSTAGLRIVGQPAVAEGNVIWIGSESLDIEPACSGLRIFIGLIAITYFVAAVSSRGWLDRIVLAAAVVPLALWVNAGRIVAIGCAYRLTDDVSIRHTVHDWLGWIMIPTAMAAVFAVQRYFATVCVRDHRPRRTKKFSPRLDKAVRSAPAASLDPTSAPVPPPPQSIRPAA